MKTKEISNKNMPFFCSNIKMLRQINGLSQEALARDIFLARSTYSDYETGKKIPDLQTIDALSAYYNIEFDLLLNHDLSTGLMHRIYIEADETNFSELLNSFQRLSNYSKGLIMERVETLIERESVFYKEYITSNIICK